MGPWVRGSVCPLPFKQNRRKRQFQPARRIALPARVCTLASSSIGGQAMAAIENRDEFMNDNYIKIKKITQLTLEKPYSPLQLVEVLKNS